MKTLLHLSSAITLAVIFSGCLESRAGTTATEPVPAATYKAGYGVQLSQTARTFAGLETGDVVSHAFAGAGEATAVPIQALLRTVRGDFVYVGNGDWFLRTPVTTGAIDGTHVEIKEGLYEGDTVVVGGVRALSLTEVQALNGGVGCADGH